MRIVSVCRELPNPGNSSIGVFVLRRLEAMARQEDVEIVQPVNYFPLIRPLPSWGRDSRVSEGGARISAQPMFYLPGIMKRLDGWWLSRSLARSLRKKAERPIDALDAHFGYPEGVGSVIVARRFNIPVFVTLRGFEVEYARKPGIGQQMLRAISAADGCICVSHYLKEFAISNGVPEEKLHVVHNGIDRSLFQPSSRELARTRLGLSVSEKIVISVGHLIPRKGHHVLISAFAQVRKSINGARLLIVGGDEFEPGYSKQLVDLCNESGLSQSVDFLGNVDAGQIGDYLRAADLFALGTAREGCCNAVLEALACGIPVVTTPVGDNAWFVKDSANGYLVPVDDSQAMANAIAGALRREDWDAIRISSELGVGDWDDVATDVLRCMRETTGAR